MDCFNAKCAVYRFHANVYVDQFPWRTTGQEIILTIGTFLGVRHDFFFFLVIYRLKWQYTNVCLMRVTSHWQKCFIYITASIHSALIGSRPQLDNYLHGPQRSVVCIEIIPSPTPKIAAYPLNKVNQTLSK